MNPEKASSDVGTMYESVEYAAISDQQNEEDVESEIIT